MVQFLVNSILKFHVKLLYLVESWITGVGNCVDNSFISILFQSYFNLILIMESSNKKSG
jgi:hypothetical protein